MLPRMTSARIIAATLLVYLGSAHAQPADGQMREPYQMVRSLQMLQDQIARGDLDAHNSQPALLKRLSENFLKADATVWKEPRNSRAAVTFLLSGGSPQVVASLRSRNVLNIDESYCRRRHRLCRRAHGRSEVEARQYQAT